MTLAERRWLRLFTLCVLYVAQGIPWGFMAITLPAYLGERGLGTDAVGKIIAMTTLPYSFKWIWGPVIDTVQVPSLGRRRPWILLAQGMMALTVGTMILIPDLMTGLTALSWMIFLHTVFNSIQDVAVDALAVDLLDEKERGRANGLMYASKYGGGVIGGAGISTLISWVGLRSALVAQTAVLLAIMLVPLLVREGTAAVARGSIGQVARSLCRAFRLRSTLLTGVLMLGVNLPAALLAAIATVLYTQRLGWTATAYGQLVGGPVLVIGLGGSVLGGFVADRFGHRRLAAVGSAGMALIWLVFAVGEPWWGSRGFVYPILLVQPLFQAAMTVSLFALCMDVSWPRIAATQFTAYMAFSNLSSTLGARLAGPADRWLDFAGLFVAAAVLQLAVTAILPFIDPGQTRRTLPAE